MFYEVDGKLPFYINLDDVSWVGTTEHSKGFQRTFKMKDGSTHTAFAYTVEMEFPSPPMLMAAQPGYYVLSCYGEPNDPVIVVERYPVIGWLRTEIGNVQPVLLDPEVTVDYVGLAILQPDGRVIVPYDTTYKDEVQWLEHEKDELLKRRADEKKAAE